MTRDEIINWLLEGDVSVQYQTHRDLLGEERPDLRSRIETEGWGAAFLSKRKPEGHWGQAFYQPKWTSSNYSVLDIKNLCIDPHNQLMKDSVRKIAEEEKGDDGGINVYRELKQSDLCINGMFLNYASYFQLEEKYFESVVDFILSQQMPDGGFNCRLNRSGAKHSSMHTTLSVLEGIAEYEKNGYTYRLPQLKKAQKNSEEFLLIHRLFLSDRTGEIINKKWLKMPYPRRWYYDVLSALDYFQYARVEFDDQLQPAIEVVLKKRNKNGTWNLNAKYPGQIHFEMEKPGKPSRVNTLRAMRVLNYFGIDF